MGASKVVAIERGCNPTSNAVSQTVEVVQRIGQVLEGIKKTPRWTSVRPVVWDESYLLKEGLRYELLVRGINSDSDVHTSRRLFRAVVTDKVPCDLRNLTIQSVEEPLG